MKTSYDRATNGRSAYLQELLEYVYHTTNINYENNESVEGVSKGSSIFGSCKFEKRKSMGHYCERFRELFEYSLLNDEFEFTPPWEKNPTLGTDSILINVEKYLAKYSLLNIKIEITIIMNTMIYTYKFKLPLWEYRH